MWTLRWVTRLVVPGIGLRLAGPELPASRRKTQARQTARPADRTSPAPTDHPNQPTDGPSPAPTDHPTRPADHTPPAHHPARPTALGHLVRPRRSFSRPACGPTPVRPYPAPAAPAGRPRRCLSWSPVCRDPAV